MDLSSHLHPRQLERALPRAEIVGAAACVAGLISLSSAPSPLILGLRALAVLLGVAALVLGSSRLFGRLKQVIWRSAAARLVAREATAGFVTDRRGRILFRNRPAGERLSAASPWLEDALKEVFAAPGATVHELLERAGNLGSAREEAGPRPGSATQQILHVQKIGHDSFIWRLAEGDGRSSRLSPRTGAADTPELASMVTGPAGTVLYVNEPFLQLFGSGVDRLETLFGARQPVSGRRYRLQGLDGPVECLVAETAAATEDRRSFHFLPAGEEVTRWGEGAAWEDIEDLPVPLLKLDTGGALLAANREARALLDIDADLAARARLSDLLEGLGRPLSDWLRDCAEGRGTQRPEFLKGRGAASECFVQVSLNAAGPSDNRHIVAVLNDVTRYKSLEAQFVQSQKMQAIGQLAGGVAHDFNNLLTAIAGHCDLLLLRRDQGDPDYGDLVQIHQNVNRAASLVGQLLAFSRKQTLRPEQIDLRDSLSELTHLLNRLVGERVSLVLEHEPELLPIRADKRQLEQVLMNLIVNARDSMPEGGTIRIETANLRLTERLQRDQAAIPAGQWVTVTVSDEGHGIPADSLPKIFEPFFTTKKPGEGTGLGLSMAYGIVKQTGGYIFADSVDGEGTTFTLYFQHSPARAAPGSDAARPASPVAAGEGVVLLVEDEAPVRAFAARALQLRGYTVLEAGSAEEALELLDDRGLQVHVFVTDVIMPGRDGPSWVREALVDRPETRVVFVSGYAEDAFSETQSEIPNSVFLPKPFSLEALSTTVHEQIALSRAGSGRDRTGT